MHHRETILGDEVPHQLDAPVVGGHLSAQVGQIVAQVAGSRHAFDLVCQPPRRLQQLRDALLLELAGAHELEGHDGGALLHQRLAHRRHAARRDAPHVCVVPSGGDVEDNFAGVEDRGDDGDVWQVGTPGKLGVVGHHHVTLLYALPFARPIPVRPVLQLCTHGIGHGAQMHGKVGSVGHQAAVGGEQGAAEVEALLDVDADAGALQGAPHFLRQPHEPVGEDGQLHGVLLDVLRGVHRRRGSLALHLDAHIAPRCNVPRALRLHHDAGDVIDQDGGPLNHVARLEVRQTVRWCVLPPPFFEVCRRRCCRLWKWPRVRGDVASLGQVLGAPGGTHTHIIHDDRPPRKGEPKLAAVLVFEGLGRVSAVRGAGCHHRHVGAVVPQVQESLHMNLIVGEPLFLQSPGSLGVQIGEASGELVEGAVSQLHSSRLLLFCHHVGKPNANSAEDAGIAVHKDSLHA
mmetsp:Transcript_17130/g.51272  ORF Transcript_17130/g.51272 Transcript_17130/m.51272 type:complete len:459 (-) Transcript_17130:1785-3161(-)